jgi:hypothetical protein
MDKFAHLFRVKYATRMGCKSPMMGDVFGGRRPKGLIRPRARAFPLQRTVENTFWRSLRFSGAFDSTREAANRDGFEMVESRDWKMTVFEAILARWQISLQSKSYSSATGAGKSIWLCSSGQRARVSLTALSASIPFTHGRALTITQFGCP